MSWAGIMSLAEMTPVQRMHDLSKTIDYLICRQIIVAKMHADQYYSSSQILHSHSFSMVVCGGLPF